MSQRKTSRPNKQGDYWAKNVLSWEEGAYYRDQDMLRRKASLLDRISSRFRGDSIYRRAQSALHILSQHAAGKTVLDIGCASGRFARQLLNCGATHVTGIDVSPEAIELATRRAKEEGQDSRLIFLLADATRADTPLPETDLAIALGVIEYFDELALTNFLSNLRSQYFFFSFPLQVPASRFSARSVLRGVYLKLKGCPGVFSYWFQDFQRMCGSAGLHEDSYLVRHEGQIFVTNLPPRERK